MDRQSPKPLESAGREPVTVAGQRQISRVPRRLQRILALDDFEASAKRYLPRPIFGFVAGGAETGASLDGNRAAFTAHRFVPRVLRDTSDRSQMTSLLGRRMAAPFGIAPMGGAILAAFEADLVLAASAKRIGIPFVLSASSQIPMEDVARAGDAVWFQAYLPGEPKRIEALVRRASMAGFETLVLTVDLPVPGNRENNIRNGFSLPLQPSARLAWDGIIRPRWLLGNVARTLLSKGMPHFENMDATRGPPILSRNLVRAVGRRDGLSWSHVDLIRSQWKGKLILKGILSGGDARLAKEAGADGVIVSNHGGRQLDSAIAPLDALADVAREAGDMAVMIDGGIRRGTDVLKALALGAHFVFLGRPFLYAAAIAGERGVAHAAALLSEEIDRNMAMLGITTVAGMTPDLLASPLYTPRQSAAPGPR
jgi:L-lactate dehydrogenase (cytochrome)